MCKLFVKRPDVITRPPPERKATRWKPSAGANRVCWGCLRVRARPFGGATMRGGHCKLADGRRLRGGRVHTTLGAETETQQTGGFSGKNWSPSRAESLTAHQNWRFYQWDLAAYQIFWPTLIRRRLHYSAVSCQKPCHVDGKVQVFARSYECWGRIFGSSVIRFDFCSSGNWSDSLSDE